MKVKYLFIILIKLFLSYNNFHESYYLIGEIFIFFWWKISYIFGEKNLILLVIFINFFGENFIIFW